MAYNYDDVMTALRNADQTGNVEDAKKLAEIAQSLSSTKKIDFSIPTEEALSTSSVKPQPYRTLGEKAVGAGEAALSALSTIPAVAGGYYGLTKNVLQGKPAEEGLIEGMSKMTYSPRTEMGRQYTENLGEAINKTGIQGLGPMVLPTKGMPMISTRTVEEVQPSTGILRKASESLMQSALKPTLSQLKSGQAKTAINTLLEYGINPTMGGVEKIRSKIGDINDEIATALEQSKGSVSKQNVLARTADVYNKFAQQVAPTSDLSAIESVTQDFLRNNRGLGPQDVIPVQLAQKLKQGTYKVLSGKYGEAGSAATEAQKALARGLKEEIATEVPGIAQLNAQESKLIDTLNVTERRALMDLNKNPAGLSILASNPKAFAAFMADKSALFKSLAARALNKVSGVNLNPVQPTENALIGGANLISNVNPSKASQLANILLQNQNKE